MRLPAILIPGAVGIAVAGLLVGWILYSRQQSAKEFDRVVERKNREAAERFRKAYGSDDVRIAGFTARPGTIRHGQETLLCYGVANAKVVKLDPPVESVHPAMTYCFNLSPARTTKYT
jgi:hypothetical protein